MLYYTTRLFYSVTNKPGKEEELNQKLLVITPYLGSYLKYYSDRITELLLNLACYINNPENAKAILRYSNLFALSTATADLFLKHVDNLVGNIKQAAHSHSHDDL